MNREERLDDPMVGLVAAMEGSLSNVWTALPGIVQAFDATALTCDVQIALRARVQQSDGTFRATQITKLIMCPVLFPGGGGFLSTFPLAAGDEVLVVFAKWCIDAWWQSSGVQDQLDVRQFDLSDGFAIPCPYSKPKVPANVSTTKAQMRNRAGTSTVEIDANGKSRLVAGSSSLEVDPSLNRVTIAAIGGLWVNGVQVIVP